MEEKTQAHESFGLLSFSRVSGGDGNLFGSSIKHNEKIRIEIKPGKVSRHLNRDWYSSNGRRYIEAEMSYSQFAEAITSMNMGSGVPITFSEINGKQIERPEIDNKRIQFEEEFKNSMQELTSRLTELTEATEDILTNKKTINKGDRETILKDLKMLHQQLHANIPFVQSSFNRQMDKTVREAKGEIESFAMRKVNELGVTSLQELSSLEHPRPTPTLLDAENPNTE
jgi:hypothetical protein